MDLVVGATGPVGSEIVRGLAERGRHVRALVRATSDPGRVEVLEGLGAEVLRGDLREASSILEACRDIDTIVSTASAVGRPEAGTELSPVDLDGQRDLVGTAARAGVSHLIYVSISEQMRTPSPLHDAKRAVEQALMNSGIPHTILRPGFFQEVWLSPVVGFDYPNAKATIYGKGDAPISFVSLKDVARIAVEAAVSGVDDTSLVEIGGPDAMRPLDVVGIFEDAMGRTFEVTHVPEDELRERLGEGDLQQQSISALMADHAAGVAIDMTETLRRFPIELGSVRDYAEQVAASG